ncbi:MAG: hypothetical protein HY811_12100 [Planctomycetes bacterium]|nr:hypothetical protein [Planctomycetota bacterium]
MPTKNRLLILLILILTFSTVTGLHAVSIKLRDGSYVQGEITDWDDNGFDFKKWGSEAIIRFKWTQLPQEEITRLYDFLDIKIQGNQVEAERIYLKSGKTMVGIKISETDKELTIKTKDGEKIIPLDNIWLSEKTKVSILDIYTPQEAYDMEVKKYDLAKAEDNYKLAEYCVATLVALDKARLHFDKAVSLDASYKEKVEKRVAEMNLAALKQEIQKIENVLLKGKTKDAATALDKLKKMPEFKNNPDAQKIFQETQQKITDYEKKNTQDVTNDLVKRIIGEYYKTVEASVSKIAFDNKLSYSIVTQYADTYLLKEVTSKVAEKMDMEEAEIDKMWKTRTLEQSKKRTISYGDGSFLKASSMKAPDPSDISEYARYEEKMALINQAKSDASQKKKLLNSDTWWKNATASSKKDWLLAYFGERQGKGVDRKTEFCPNCRGEGITRKSSKSFELCTRCQGCMQDLYITYY